MALHRSGIVTALFLLTQHPLRLLEGSLAQGARLHHFSLGPLQAAPTLGFVSLRGLYLQGQSLLQLGHLLHRMPQGRCLIHLMAGRLLHALALRIVLTQPLKALLLGLQALQVILRLSPQAGAALAGFHRPSLHHRPQFNPVHPAAPNSFNIARVRAMSTRCRMSCCKKAFSRSCKRIASSRSGLLPGW